MKKGGPLGLSIIGGSDHSCVPFGVGDPGIYISKVSSSNCIYFSFSIFLFVRELSLEISRSPPFQIIPGGAASQTGKLRMGDRLLFVNGIDVRDCSHEQAVVALLSKIDTMKLTVQHDPLPKGFQVSPSRSLCKEKTLHVCRSFPTGNQDREV